MTPCLVYLLTIRHTLTITTIVAYFCHKVSLANTTNNNLTNYYFDTSFFFFLENHCPCMDLCSELCEPSEGAVPVTQQLLTAALQCLKVGCGSLL